MDPDVTLANIRAAIAHGRTVPVGDTDWSFREVADAVEALDEWLSKGGFLPEDWAQIGRGMELARRAAERGNLTFDVIEYSD